MVIREEGVDPGFEVCKDVFGLVDRRDKVNFGAEDRHEVVAGRILAEVRGLVISILSSQRVGLKFLQGMSSIATLTRRFVREVKGTGGVILDTSLSRRGRRICKAP